MNEIERITDYLKLCGVEPSQRNIAFQQCKELIASLNDETSKALYHLIDQAQGFNKPKGTTT
jgi:hypothetical protein